MLTMLVNCKPRITSTKIHLTIVKSTKSTILFLIRIGHEIGLIHMLIRMKEVKLQIHMKEILIKWVQMKGQMVMTLPKSIINTFNTKKTNSQ